MRDDREAGDGMWFAPKRFGYGAGLPIAWQGWVALVAYVALVITAGRWWPHGAPLVVVLATIVLAIVAYRKTCGGWHWRGWR